MLDLSIKDTAQGPKNYHSLYFPYIENLRGEDNLSIKHMTTELILSPKCTLFESSTVLAYSSGKNRLTRIATVNTSFGEYKRPVHKIPLLLHS